MDYADIGLYIGYTLFILGAGAAIIMPLINAASNPSVLVKSAIGFGVLIAIFAIGYVLASDEVTPLYESKAVGASVSKITGGAIITFWVLLFTCFAGVAYTEVSKFFK